MTLLPAAENAAALFRIKLVHTAFWAFFATAVVAVLAFAAAGWLGWAAGASAVVWVEVAILAVNRMHCPLTAVAARLTDNRRPNFDIFLPAWLAANNKLIFGTLFAIGEIMLLWRWATGS